jgi:hypothetical protein
VLKDFNETARPHIGERAIFFCILSFLEGIN